MVKRLVLLLGALALTSVGIAVGRYVVPSSQVVSSGPGARSTTPTSTTAPASTNQAGSIGSPVFGRYDLAEAGGLYLTITESHQLGSDFFLIEVIDNSGGSQKHVEELAATGTAGILNVTSDTYSYDPWGTEFIGTYKTNPPSITFPANRCQLLWSAYAGNDAH